MKALSAEELSTIEKLESDAGHGLRWFPTRLIFVALGGMRLALLRALQFLLGSQMIKQPPAMASGLTDHVWTIAELLR